MQYRCRDTGQVTTDGGPARGCGIPDQVRQRIRVHLSHHLAAMRFDGDFADAKFERHLLVQQTRHDQSHRAGAHNRAREMSGHDA